MIRAALILAAVAAVLAAAPPAAHAKGKLQANVVSMPSALAPGEPVAVVLELYVLDHTGEEHPLAGRMSDVAVVLVPLAVAGEVDTQHFPAEHLGDGRYAAEIVFPASGGWALRVATGLGMPAIRLGKGAVHVPEPKAASSAAARPVRAAGLLVALLLTTAAVAALVARGRRAAAGEARTTATAGAERRPASVER